MEGRKCKTEKQKNVGMSLSQAITPIYNKSKHPPFIKTLLTNEWSTKHNILCPLKTGRKVVCVAIEMGSLISVGIILKGGRDLTTTA